MKQLCIVVLALTVFLSAAPVSAQETQKNDGKATEAEKQPPTHEDLARMIKVMRGFVGEEGIGNLKRRAGDHPFLGVGIRFKMNRKEMDEATGREDFAMAVSGVYLGSPAERAGIWPGDWLVRVNGKPTCKITITLEAKQAEDQRNEKQKEYNSCLAATKELFSGGDRVVLEVERSGTLRRYDLEKAQIGQEVADFFAAHEAEWGTTLRSSEKDLSVVAAKLDAGPDTPENLRALGEELHRIFSSFSGPFMALEEKLASTLMEE